MKFPLSIFILFFCPLFYWAQTYELTGNPINITGWTLVSDAVADADFIQLTPDVTWKVGAVKLDDPINLNYCEKWTVEFDFRIDGYGTSDLKMGDGIAFWYLANPPVSYEYGEGMGIPQNSVGLMVGFDTFNNSDSGQFNKIHVLYGINSGNIEFNNTAGSTYHSEDLTNSHPFVGTEYRHVAVTGEKDTVNPGRTIIKLWMNGTLLLNQSFLPSGPAANMANGYFGFSSATGGATSRHSVKNVKVFVDRVPVLQHEFEPLLPCPDYETGLLNFDLTQFENQIVSDPQDFIISYFDAATGAEITVPGNYQFGEDKTVNVVVADPATILCNAEVKIKLNGNFLNVQNDTLESCGFENSAVFDLSEADITNETGITKEYYHTLGDLLSGTDPVPGFENYETSDFSDVFVKITDSEGCFRYSVIHLVYKEGITASGDELRACTAAPEISEAAFNLTDAEVTQESSATVQYFIHESDAVQNINFISNPAEFTSVSGIIYARVSLTNGCYDIAEIQLTAGKPVRISHVQVNGNQITVETVGGTPPLYYSLDGTNWQMSNILAVSEGGSHTVYVKDDFGCSIAVYEVVVLNIPNVITPNNDGINDELDLSLLSSKPNFRFLLFDRYGAKIFSSEESPKMNWNGKVNGRNAASGTYWYVLSWNEPDDFSTFVKYTGWILVKNLE